MTKPTKKESFDKAQDKWEKEARRKLIVFLIARYSIVDDLTIRRDAKNDAEVILFFIHQTISQEVKEALERVRLGDWDKLPKEAQESFKVRTGFGAYDLARKIIDQKIKKELK